jgi:outer membrane lipoprotein SlyB
MNASLRWVAAVFAAALVAAGCARPTQSGYSYTEREARQPMRVETGVLQAVRQVRLERSQSDGVGGAAGAVVGGVAGSNVGGGSGRIVGSVLGALAGGVAGSHAEKAMSDRAALELTVRTDGGRSFAVVQEAGGEQFTPGQRVRILTDSRGTVRVSH